MNNTYPSSEDMKELAQRKPLKEVFERVKELPDGALAALEIFFWVLEREGIYQKKGMQ